MDSVNLKYSSSSSFNKTSSSFVDLSEIDKVNAIPNKTSDNILMDGLSAEDQLYLEALIDIDSDHVNDDDNISHRSSTWSPMVTSPVMDNKRYRKLRPSYAITLSLKDISYIRPSWGISKGVKEKKIKNKSSSLSIASSISSSSSLNDNDRSSSTANKLSKNEPAYHYFLILLTIIVVCLIITTYIVDKINERDSIQINRINISIGQKYLDLYKPNIDSLERILKVQFAQSIPRDLRPDKCTCDIYSSETKRFNSLLFNSTNGNNNLNKQFDDDNYKTCFACFDWAFRANLRIYIDKKDKINGLNSINMKHEKDGYHDSDNNNNSNINSTTCYNIKWQSYDGLQTPLVDCFIIDQKKSEQWFGLGDIQGPLWSLNELQFDWTPLVTNLSAEFRHTHTAKAASNQLALGSHVDYSLFSTKGIYIGNIYTDFETSFKIMNDSKSGIKRMCLSASCTDKCSQTWARIDHLERLRYHNNYLEYSICTSSDMNTLISRQLLQRTSVEYETIREYKFINDAITTPILSTVITPTGSTFYQQQQQQNNSTTIIKENLPLVLMQNNSNINPIYLDKIILQKESKVEFLNNNNSNNELLNNNNNDNNNLTSSNTSISSFSISKEIQNTQPNGIIVKPELNFLITGNNNQKINNAVGNLSTPMNIIRQQQQSTNINNNNNNNNEQDLQLPEGVDLIERTIFFVSRDFMPTLNGETLRQYIDNVTNLNLKTNQVLLIDTRWEVYIGSLKLNQAMFPKANELFELIHEKNFKVIFTIKPYIDSGIGVSNINQLFKNGRLYTANYKKDTHMEFGFQAKEAANIKETLIRRKSLFTFAQQPIEIGLNDTVKFPYQFKCRESREGYCVLLDLTQQSNRIWFISNIRRSNLFTVKADGLQIGGAHPNRFYWDDNFRQGISELAKNLMFKENLYTLPQWTGDFNYIQLAPRECNWNSLRSIVNSVLNLGMMGFSLIHPGSVWGDLKKTAEVIKPPVQTTVLASYRMESILDDEDIDENSTEEELIIRWLQISIFMPILQFNNLLPIERHNLQELLKNLTQIRREFILPEMEKNLPFTPLMNRTKYNQMDNVKLPLIRPVNIDRDQVNGEQLIVAEQFSVGSDIIVAPIMKENQRKRDIYLPNGIWRDELKKTIVRGSRWLKNYTIELKEVAWFTRVDR